MRKSFQSTAARLTIVLTAFFLSTLLAPPQSGAPWSLSTTTASAQEADAAADKAKKRAKKKAERKARKKAERQAKKEAERKAKKNKAANGDNGQRRAERDGSAKKPKANAAKKANKAKRKAKAARAKARAAAAKADAARARARAKKRVAERRKAIAKKRKAATKKANRGKRAPTTTLQVDADRKRRAAEKYSTPQPSFVPRSGIAAARAAGDEARRKRANKKAKRRSKDKKASKKRRERRAERARRATLSAVQKKRRKRRGRAGRVIIAEPDGRSIVRKGSRAFIRNSDGRRLRRRSRSVRVERRGNGTRRTIVTRNNGVKVITITDRDGRLLRRVRRGPRGREVILIDNRRRHHHRHRRYASVGLPFLLGLAMPSILMPRHRYIIDADHASYDDIYDALAAPPIEDVDDYYTLDEVRYNYPLRARMRSVDITTINFEFGSWYVDEDDYDQLEDIARAINRVLRKDPEEIFLVEGHTDAVGDEDDNLSLSDRRAETVATILTEEFDVPPENLTTQGYGEEFLKVRTQAPSRVNRRVTVRRITPLMRRRLAERRPQYDDGPRRGAEPYDDFDRDDDRSDYDRYDDDDTREYDSSEYGGDLARPDEDEVQEFVTDKYLSGDDLSPSQLRRMYAPRVDHFGRSNIDVSRLIQEKQEYYDRWPDRDYELDEDSFTIAPGREPGTVEVSFEFSFELDGGGRSSRGRGETNLVLEERDDGFVILSENGRVIERR